MSTLLRRLVAALLAGAAVRRMLAKPPPSARDRIALAVAAHPWLAAGAVAAALAVGGLVVLASGIVPIFASSGHWPFTRWLLDAAKVRSVSTHSLGITVPPLDDPALILRGAGHYEIGCAFCHGRPTGAVPAVPAAMTPRPPFLTPLVSRWDPEELFTIVRHGLKFTGMPAWPVAGRDDEVWAVVAFLQRMPSLSEPEYRALATPAIEAMDGTSLSATGAPAPPLVVRRMCARCHGANGLGRAPGAFPVLAGQKPDYLRDTLLAYRGGTRHSGIMAPIAQALPDTELREAVEYYASLPRPTGAGGAADAGVISRGATIAQAGIPDRDIPACAQCHGPADRPRNPHYPILTGQDARYLALQLRLLQQRHRGGAGYEHLMHVFVNRLQPADIEAVTRYYAAGAR